MTTADELRRAINQHDMARIDALLTGDPSLRQVLIDDVPLQALAQPGCRPIMELLVRHGADVNGLCWGWFPVLFTPLRIWSRNRYSGFSITEPTPIAGTPKTPAPPSTMSFGHTRAIPVVSRPAFNSFWPLVPTRATTFPESSRSFAAVSASWPQRSTPTRRSSIAVTANWPIAASRGAACSRYVAPPSSTWPRNTASSMPRGSFWIAGLMSMRAPRWTKPVWAAKRRSFTR